MLPSLKKLLRYLWHLIPRSIRSLIIPFINWLHDLAGDEGTFLVSAKRFDEAKAQLKEKKAQLKERGTISRHFEEATTLWRYYATAGKD